MKSFFLKAWPFFALSFLALVLHFAWLNYPSQVVFDEVHFGKFVAGYFTHEYFFDIHPPLGKMMIAFTAKAFSVNPVFAFDRIGEAVPAATLVALRFLPALFGAGLVLLFSWLAYLLSRRRSVALFAGALAILDTALLVQSKFILVDIFLLCFEILTLIFFLLYQRQPPGRRGRRLFFLGLTGLFFGLTISVKWTGLAVLSIIGLALAGKFIWPNWAAYFSPQNNFNRRKNFREIITNLLIIGTLGFLMYLIPFWFHFKILDKPGPGNAFMSQTFQAELKYGRGVLSAPLTFPEKFLELNQTMFRANAGITSEHAFGSRWWGWPFNVRPVYYWNQEIITDHSGWQAKIYLTGNPLLWWLVFFGVLAAFAQGFFRSRDNTLKPAFLWLVAAYLVNLLPFIFIGRISFLYHYLPSLLFGLLILSLWLDQLWPKYRKLLLAIFLLLFLNFLLLTPLVYGWPLPALLSDWLAKLMLFFR